MKRRSGLIYFLLVLSFLIPFNVAYLYIDYYSDMDFTIRKHFASDDDERLLTLFKKNPRVLPNPGLFIQPYVFMLPEVSFFQTCSILSRDSENPVLRC